MIELLFTTLGTYGIATIIAEYSGPFGMFAKLPKREPWDCNVCLGTWLLLPVYLLVCAGWGIPVAALGGLILIARYA